jgi:hypothetical protein
MTQAEFNAAQITARNKWEEIVKQGSKDLSDLYIKSADEVAEKIRTLQANSRGTGLTVKSLQSLEATLRATGKKIAQGTIDITINGIDDIVTINSKPHLKYIGNALELAEVPDRLIDFDIVEGMHSQLNETMIGLTYTRLWPDGYKFEQRIWGFPGNNILDPKLSLSQEWQKDIKNIVEMGFMQNRDVLKIAQDIAYYAANGKIKLMKRYGKLIRGTKSFSRRIPEGVDWRALRIARSELYISLQESAKFQGQLNPAVNFYKWNLTGGVDHDPNCLDFAADSPYRELDIPAFPHPNCLCFITHIIRERDEFVNDLIDWTKGAGVPYLDEWYTGKYLPFINKG